MSIIWPTSDASEFALWTREVLRWSRGDAVWLACEPLNMCAGAESVLGRRSSVRLDLTHAYFLPTEGLIA